MFYLHLLTARAILFVSLLILLGVAINAAGSGFRPETCSFIGGTLFLVAFIPYNIHLARGGESVWVSWLVWCLLDTSTLAGMLAKEAANWQIIAAVIGGWITFGFVVNQGRPQWGDREKVEKRDKLCLAGAAVGFVLWLAADASWGITAFMATLLIGSWPIVQETWKHPGQESFLAWCLFLTSCVFTVAGIAAEKTWTLANAAQPLAFLAVETVVVFVLIAAPRRPDQIPD